MQVEKKLNTWSECWFSFFSNFIALSPNISDSIKYNSTRDAKATWSKMGFNTHFAIITSRNPFHLLFNCKNVFIDPHIVLKLLHVDLIKRRCTALTIAVSLRTICVIALKSNAFPSHKAFPDTFSNIFIQWVETRLANIFASAIKISLLLQFRLINHTALEPLLPKIVWKSKWPWRHPSALSPFHKLKWEKKFIASSYGE